MLICSEIVTGHAECNSNPRLATWWTGSAKGLLLGAALLLGVGAACAGPIDDGVAAYKRGDYATALPIFRSLATQGDARAQTDLGLMYDTGEGVAQDYAEAIKWYRLAAAQGYAWAQTDLGAMYARGHGVTQDYIEAVRLFRISAAQGNANAQTSLGAMYESGHGVTQDYAEAIKWYRLAAAQGYARAQANLGLMYLDGQGVAKNLNEAERLLRLATDQNLVGAVALLVEVQRQLAQAQTVAPMSVEDFLLDTKELDGHVIAVHGVAMCMGADLCFLYPGPMQVNQGVAFEPTGLPREDRRKLLDCNLFLKNCPLTVIGRVSADAMIAKLIARQVEW